MGAGYMTWGGVYALMADCHYGAGRDVAWRLVWMVD